MLKDTGYDIILKVVYKNHFLSAIFVALNMPYFRSMNIICAIPLNAKTLRPSLHYIAIGCASGDIQSGRSQYLAYQGYISHI